MLLHAFFWRHLWWFWHFIVSYLLTLIIAMCFITKLIGWWTSYLSAANFVCVIPIFQYTFNELFLSFNRFLGLKITMLLCTVLNRCVLIKCFVTTFCCLPYWVNGKINQHLHLQLFEKVEATKPSASRSTSAEIYIICLKYKAPAKIQPELLDIKHLFSVVPEQNKVC